MIRVLLSAAVALAALSSIQPSFAIDKIATNGTSLNKLAVNKLSANGTSLNTNRITGNGIGLNAREPNGIPVNLLPGSVDEVTSIVLPSGEIIRR